MYGFRSYRRVNPQVIAKALEKLEKGELSIEDILDEEEYVFDLKSTSYSHLAPCINKEKMLKLIDYVTIEHSNPDDKKSGYKFPFNACDILSSENLAIIDKFFEEEVKAESQGKKNSSADGSDFENEGDEFKAKIIIETNNKENAEKHNLQNNEEGSNNNQGQPTALNPNEPVAELHLEADNNMSSEKLLIFEEIAGMEQKETDQNKIANDNKEAITVNVSQEQDQIPSAENPVPEVNYIISEDNYFSNEKKVEKKHEITYLVIDHLIKFVESQDNLNYVLSGYFSKIFLNLLNLKTNNFLKYILGSRRGFIKNLVRHSYMKSISDVIIKILNTNLSEIEEEEVKKEIIIMLIEGYSKQLEENTSSVCELLAELISNKNIFYLVVKNEQIFRTLYSLASEKNDKNRDLLRVITKLNETLLKDIAGTATSINNNAAQNFWMQFSSNMNIGGDEESKENYLEPSNFNYIFDILSGSLNILYESFNIEEGSSVQTTASTKTTRTLGLRKIYQLDYYRSVLEIALNANSSLNFQNSPHLISLIENLSNATFIRKITDLFCVFEWNNMYQKSYENVVSLFVNRFTPYKLIQAVFEDIKIQDLFVSHVFEKDFTFDSGRRIFNGNFSFICELSIIISNTENVQLKKLMDLNENWKEFCKNFAKPIKEKFTLGLQFPKEGFFEESQEQKIQKPENEKSESMNEIFVRCKSSLSFCKQSEEKSTSDETDDKLSQSSPVKTNSNIQSTDIAIDPLIVDPEVSRFYDNNYWNPPVSDFELEID